MVDQTKEDDRSVYFFMNNCKLAVVKVCKHKFVIENNDIDKSYRLYIIGLFFMCSGWETIDDMNLCVIVSL